MLPPAPGRSSTTTFSPSTFAISAATGRATTSAEPPAAYGTIMAIGRDGNRCACAAADASSSDTISNRRTLSPLLLLRQRVGAASAGDEFAGLVVDERFAARE